MTTYYIKRDRKRDGISYIDYWNGAAWCRENAKCYAFHKNAERALQRLMVKCEAFSDECTIVEETI